MSEITYHVMGQILGDFMCMTTIKEDGIGAYQCLKCKRLHTSMCRYMRSDMRSDHKCSYCILNDASKPVISIESTIGPAGPITFPTPVPEATELVILRELIKQSEEDYAQLQLFDKGQSLAMHMVSRTNTGLKNLLKTLESKNV